MSVRARLRASPRRVHAWTAAGLVAIAAAISACAAERPPTPMAARSDDADTTAAQAMLDSLYRRLSTDGDHDTHQLLTAHGSRALVSALVADRDATPVGEVGRLDFDPFSDSQDPLIRDVVVSAPARASGSACAIVVRFDNAGTPTRIRFALVRENGEWKIDDMLALAPDGTPRWRLRDLLAPPASDTPDR